MGSDDYRPIPLKRSDSRPQVRQVEGLAEVTRRPNFTVFIRQLSIVTVLPCAIYVDRIIAVSSSSDETETGEVRVLRK
jgi:hypothetical protein